MKVGALGHGIMYVDTKKLMSVKGGVISSADINSVKKGKKGSPGELIGDIKYQEKLGNVNINNSYGIYGRVESVSLFEGSKTVPIAGQNDVVEGPAVIMSNIAGGDIVEYDVNIETVNHHSTDKSKGMVIKIIDEDLLSKTGGIVQGMSGSPIVQNGKLIGAVTHVFIQEPAKGYGIFIENMMMQDELY
jgi:stage IV sporulation protein B